MVCHFLGLINYPVYSIQTRICLSSLLHLIFKRIHRLEEKEKKPVVGLGVWSYGCLDRGHENTPTLETGATGSCGQDRKEKEIKSSQEISSYFHSSFHSISSSIHSSFLFLNALFPSSHTNIFNADNFEYCGFFQALQITLRCPSVSSSASSHVCPLHASKRPKSSARERLRRCASPRASTLAKISV